jgi:type IV secretory pathway protease TraF
MLKRAAAVESEVVKIDAAAVTVNGRMLPNAVPALPSLRTD